MNAGDLDISGNVEVSGFESDLTLIDANKIDRVVHVLSNALATFRDLGILNGQALPSQDGGGIYNAGTLELQEVEIYDNQAGDGLSPAETRLGDDGGSGGGIFNAGRLGILDSSIHGNYGGTGGDSGLCKYLQLYHCKAGKGGNGGGIFNLGELEITWSFIFENHAGKGGIGYDIVQVHIMIADIEYGR